MAERHPGAFEMVKMTLGGATAGFAFGEAALLAVEPRLYEGGVILRAATGAAGRSGSTGACVVIACLVFSLVLVSLGNGFLLVALVRNLMNKVGMAQKCLVDAATGASIVAGATATGLTAGLLPPLLYLTSQGILVLVAYSSSNVNDITTALLIIFTTLYISVLFGRMGVINGVFAIGLTISALCILRKVLRERLAQKPNARSGCKLLRSIIFYSVIVGILGFSVGIGAGEAGDKVEAEVVLILKSIIWVAVLSAGLLGAGLGTVAMAGLGSEEAGNVCMGASVISFLVMRIILWSRSALGVGGTIGGGLGAAAAAGVLLGASSVAAKKAFKSRNSIVAVLGAVVVGAFVGMRGLTSNTTLLTTSELEIPSVAVGAFFLGAPKSPFHTEVNLRRGLLKGPELIQEIGMETVTAAAAPIGAGALGAAALGTAALGRLGTMGVSAAVLLAVGSTLSGMSGKSTTNTQRD